MPFKKLIPDLPEAAKAELPGATDKVKNYRGTFVAWMFAVFATIIAVLAWWGNGSNKAANREKDARLADCQQENRDVKRENEKLKSILIPAFSSAATVILDNNKKIDSVIKK